MDKKAFNKLSYGVYILSTVTSEGKQTGCTVNSVIQVSSQPPTFAASVNKENYTCECIKSSGRFALSVLSEKSAPLTIGKMGYFTGRDTDKFADVPHSLMDGIAVVNDACAQFVCTVKETVDAGTHMIFIADVDDSVVLDTERPMTYAYYHEVLKGKTPAKAPTFTQ